MTEQENQNNNSNVMAIPKTQDVSSEESQQCLYTSLLTTNQKQMYFLQCSNPQSRAFNVPSSVTLTSTKPNKPINLHHLTHSICCIIELHESLRVTVHEVMVDGKAEVVQRVWPITHFRNSLYRVLDLTNLSAEEQTDRMRKELNSFALEHLPLDKQLFAFKLFVLQPSYVLIAVSIHHIVYDGVSILVLVRDLVKCAGGCNPGRLITIDHQLSCLPVREPITIMHKQIEEWKDLLQGTGKMIQFSDTNIPFTPESHHAYIPLSAEVQKSLQKLSRSMGVPQTTLLITVMCCALGTLAGVDDIVAGLLGMNRTEKQQDFIGYYAKTLPLRVNFSSKPPLHLLVKSVLKNCGMVFDSSIELPDLVSAIPCLQHRAGEFSPFHILLSIYHFTMCVPSVVDIDKVSVDVKLNHAFQVHFQADLFVEIHPRGMLNPTMTVHYQYLDQCFNANLVSIIQKEVANLFLKIHENECISVDSFPKIKVLSEWRKKILPTLPSLSVPTNVSSGKGKPVISLETLIRTYESSIQGMLLMAAFAYVLCRYCNQENIGILLIRKGSVIGLCFDKLTGEIETVIKHFSSVLERSIGLEIPIAEFNSIHNTLPKCKGNNYLVWCEGQTEPDDLSCEMGIHVNCTPSSGNLLLKISTRVDWFDKQSLPIIVKSFEKFYKNVGRYRFEDINIETIPYWQDITYSAKPPLCNIPLDVCYIRQLEKRVAQRFSHWTAFTYQDTHMTYGLMMQQVIALGLMVYNNAINYGGSNIGVYLTRTPLLYVSLLAVLKAGFAYVPISLDTPHQRLLLILKLSNVGVLLTESSLVENLHGYNGKVMCVDALSLVEDVSDAPTPEVDVDLLSCILYTSGTTGTPKGVMITNRNILHAINNIIELSTLQESAVTLASANIVFDAHVIDSLTPLLRGRRLVVVDNVSHMVPGVTHAFATPSAVCCVDIPASIQSLVVGGEPFTNACHEKIRDVAKVTNLYGPTECSVFVTATVITDSFDPCDPSNIGHVVPGCDFQILNFAGNPVPPSFPGILHITGPQVTRGYYNNIERTKKSFSFWLSKYRQYCTGDWVRLLQNDSLQFLGRLDHQIKLRGQRFELLEVENTIYNFHSVKAVCAFVQEPGRPSAMLLACVSPETVSVQSLTDHLKASLPLYMIPKVIIPLEELPLNEIGKIDRAKLRVIANMKMDEKVNTKEAKGIEREIANIFAQVLEIESGMYSVHDDFFTRGGHSLLVVSLVAMINQRLGSNINASHILQYSTPSKLANHIPSNTCSTSLEEPSNCDDNLSSLPTLSGQDDNGIKSEFYFKLGEKFGELSALSKLLSLSAANLCKDYVKGTTCSYDKVSFVPVENHHFDNEDMLDLHLQLPRVEGPMSPLDYYYKKVVPLKHVQLVYHPESFFDFGFLNPIPSVSFSDLFTKELASGNFQRASDILLKETGIFKSPDSIKIYADVFDNPESALKKHIKIKTFLSFKPDEPLLILHNAVSSTESPLIFVHGGIIGWPLPYLSLSKQYKQHSVAVQHTTSTPTHCFRQMAEYFMKAIVDFQPHGPYSLFGTCYGACLAYEIAHLLIANGHRVKLLTMINNSPVQECRPALFDPYGRPLPGTALDPIAFFTTLLDVPFPHGKLQLSPSYSELRSVVNVLVNTYPWIDLSKEDLIDLYQSFYNRTKCLWDHTPLPTADEIETCLLIRNKTHPFFKSEDYGMSQLVKNLVVVTREEDLGYLSELPTTDFVLRTMMQYL